MAATINDFQSIFNQADKAHYYDPSKKLLKIWWLERLVKIIFACCCKESTTQKCIRISSETLLAALRNPQGDPILGRNFIGIIEELETMSSPKTIKLAAMIEAKAPGLILKCIEANQERRQIQKRLQYKQKLAGLCTLPRPLTDIQAQILDEERKYIEDTYPESDAHSPIYCGINTLKKRLENDCINNLPTTLPNTNLRTWATTVIEGMLDSYNTGSTHQCTIKTILGQTHHVQCLSDQLGVHLKKAIDAVSRIPIGQMRLIYNHQTIENGESLNTIFASDPNPTFHMTLRLHG